MTAETLRFLLQIAGVFIGGSAVQLLIFLIRRKAEVRSLDVASDVGLLGAAQAQVAGLTATETSLRKVIDDKDARIDALLKRLSEEQTDHARTLDECEANASRLSAELARTRSELTTARYQLELVTSDNRPPPSRHRRDRGEDDAW